MNLGSLALSTLADASVRSICLVILCLLALQIGRVRSVSIRHAVLTVMLGAMLLLPLVSPLLPPVPVPILPNPEQSPVQPATAGAEVVAPPVRQAPAGPASWFDDISWRQVGAVSYFVVLALMLVRLLVAQVLVRRLVRASVSIPEVEVRGILERERVGPIPALRESGWITVPVTTGCFVPEILLPSGWRDWDDAKLHAVLVHEMAHVRRGDTLIAFAASFNKCVFWFHPLAWWLERRLALLAEQAADDCSVLVLGDRERYASALIDMAAAKAGRHRLVWEAVAMAKSTEVRRRIERILDERAVVSRSVTRGRWLAIALVSVPLLFGAAAIQLEMQRATTAAEIRPPTVLAEVTTPVPGKTAERVAKLRAQLEPPYRKWLDEDVRYIIGEKERETFQQLTGDAERERFIEQFWLAKDPTPGTAANEFKEEHYRRIAYANERFAGREPGWKTDRGRMYIIFGPADEIESHPSGGNGKPPYEVWRYRGADFDGEMEFVDAAMTGEYRLEPDAVQSRGNHRIRVEIRAPLDPASLQFEKTDRGLRATVNSRVRIITPDGRPVYVFEDVLRFERKTETSDPGPLWWQMPVRLKPGEYRVTFHFKDAGSGRMESREMSLTVPAEK